MIENDRFNVLFLCTGNSARSVLSEALLNRLGNGAFIAHSAGSNPKGEVHPKTIEILKKNNFKTDHFKSKSWDEFIEENAPQIDIVVTVCSNAANETCPIFPGNPISIHWDIDDPAREFDDDEDQRKEFIKIYKELEQRIKKLITITVEALDKNKLTEELKKISD